MGDVAATVDQHSDLASDLATQLRKLPCEVVVEEHVRVESSTEEAFELLDLVGLQTAGVAKDLDCGLLAAGIGSGPKTLALTSKICTGSVGSPHPSGIENRGPEGPTGCQSRSLPYLAFSTIVCAMESDGRDGGDRALGRMLNACRRNPAAICVGSASLIIVFAWRQFLLGHHSPFTMDIRHYHHPVTRALVHALREGRLPLWTDSNYFGFPLLVDPQTAAWYPPTLLIAGLGPHFGYVAFLVLHALLAAFGMLGLMRAHGVGWSSAWATGLCVALSGYFAHETQHPGLFAILCWVPCFLWASHRVFERPTPTRIAAAGLCVAMMVFAGTLQVLFGVIILYGFYGMGLVLDAVPVRGLRDTLRASGIVVLAQLLGAGLAAVVLLPALMHLPQTARSLGMTYEFAAMGSIAPLELLGMFINGAAVRPGVGLAAEELGNSYYLGSLSLVLAIVGLAGTNRSKGQSSGQSKLAIGLAIGVAVLLLIALGEHSGLHSLLYSAYPQIVGGLRGVGRALGPAAIAIAILAGLGLQALGDPDRWLQRLLVGLLALALAGYGISFAAAPESRSGNAIGSALVLLLALGLATVPLLSDRLLGSRIVNRIRALGGRDGEGEFAGVVRRGVVALAVLDLVAFGTLDGVLAKTPPPPEPQQVQDAIGELDEIADGKFGRPGERLMLHGFGPLNLPLLQGFDGVGGYNPLVMLRYLDLVHLINNARLFPRTPIDRFVSGAKPQRFESALFDATSVRYVISNKPDAVRGLRLLERYTGTPLGELGASLYENEAALPRAYLAYRTHRSTGDHDLARLLGPYFEGRRATVVEGVGPLLDGLPTIMAVEGTQESPEAWDFDVSPKHPAILVVTDTWYPGWRAWVDGVESPVFRVNALFRGVSVPLGSQRVEMRFDPWTFRVGGGISTAALFVLAALLGVGVTRGNRRVRPHGSPKK
jgi:hypothetical protein